MLLFRHFALRDVLEHPQNGVRLPCAIKDGHLGDIDPKGASIIALIGFDRVDFGSACADHLQVVHLMDRCVLVVERPLHFMLADDDLQILEASRLGEYLIAPEETAVGILPIDFLGH